MRIQHLLYTSLLVFFLALSVKAEPLKGLDSGDRLTTLNEGTNRETVLTEWKVLTPDAIFPSHLQASSTVASSVGTNLKLVEFHPQMSRTDLTIVWQQSTSSAVQVRIFDVAGQLTLSSELGEYPAGEHELQTDLSNLMPGIYSYELHVGEVMVEHPLMIIR
ncbi:MAG: hypothetical protein KDD67_17965 [Ignavibacteriae bacterium]|nr:hypothetical protein [Ignavibacteriota bacterium]MCB9214600.1 hypothetical protein [Ignavibacteria bacterium]